ncbi:NfeD family protein [Enterobacteriaceae bacterium LUAb1]
MLAEILSHPQWFWLTLGGLLLIAEMLGTSGYLLWSGIASVVTGLVIWHLPLSWEGQGVLFAVLTLSAVFIWWRWMQYCSNKRPVSTLNQRGAQLTGQLLILNESLQNGIGHVRVNDSSWRVQASEDLPAGTRVIITAVEGITLKVSPYH